jgi:hypothetical protein
VPAGAVEPLVAALRDALATPVHRLDEMGHAGRERVLDEHTAAAQVDVLELLFESTRGQSLGS